MHVLLTNDDGVHAPGLLALAQACTRLGKVTIIAPDHDWSASGLVKTMHRPLRVWDTLIADGFPALATDGAPSDCVALATLGLAEKPIDLVVSGVNPHPNLGYDAAYSGTVTAAMEATVSAIPALAVSLDSASSDPSATDFQRAAYIAVAIARQVLHRGLPKGLFLNINIPLLPVDQIKGVAITRQGKRLYHDALVQRDDPRGRPYYWIGGDPPTGIPDEFSDIRALAEGRISITPMRLDLTATDFIASLESWNITIKPDA